MVEDSSATPRRQHGHSRAYILDRLKRENQTALAAAVEAGTVSAFAAAVQCGWTKRPPSAAAVTHQARKRQLGFQAIEGGLSSGQKMELIYGPNSSQGSLFNSREELVQAWTACRDELLDRANPGRRPLAYYEFDYPHGTRPAFDTERSTLWRQGVLKPEERVELEREWRMEFDATRGKSAKERREAYEFADIPDELIEQWTPQRKRRLVASVESPSRGPVNPDTVANSPDDGLRQGEAATK